MRGSRSRHRRSSRTRARRCGRPRLMRDLTVLYDARCALCIDARRWLEAQPKFVRLRFLPAGSPGAAARFPELNPADTLHDITVVDDAGNVYRGPKAWAM